MTLPRNAAGPSTVTDPASVSGRFRTRPADVVAAQWWVNGDHPQDAVGQDAPNTVTDNGFQRVEGAVVRFYRHPEVPGGCECAHCGRIMHDHGWIDSLDGGRIVCPGDWVVTGVGGDPYPMRPDVFGHVYEPVVE